MSGVFSYYQADRAAKHHTMVVQAVARESVAALNPRTMKLLESGGGTFSASRLSGYAILVVDPVCMHR